MEAPGIVSAGKKKKGGRGKTINLMSTEGGTGMKWEYPGRKIFFLFFLFLAVLGLHCCAWAFSSCGERGLLFVAVCRVLIVTASLVAEHGL